MLYISKLRNWVLGFESLNNLHKMSNKPYWYRIFIHFLHGIVLTCTLSPVFKREVAINVFVVLCLISSQTFSNLILNSTTTNNRTFFQVQKLHINTVKYFWNHWNLSLFKDIKHEWKLFFNENCVSMLYGFKLKKTISIWFEAENAQSFKTGLL